MKAESSEVLKTVDEDRKYVIQATIVRYAGVLAIGSTLYSLVSQHHEGA